MILIRASRPQTQISILVFLFLLVSVHLHLRYGGDEDEEVLESTDLPISLNSEASDAVSIDPVSDNKDEKENDIAPTELLDVWEDDEKEADNVTSDTEDPENLIVEIVGAIHDAVEEEASTVST